MDYLVSPTEHICYVRCSYCNTVLKVIPWSRRLKMNVPQQCCFLVTHTSCKVHKQNHHAVN
ncbi:hypothetical protein BHM03_00050594 [Ensete ventricosum]|nr:hypothetical protein BHM03_00050594 [Ensete ventricosum]